MDLSQAVIDKDELNKFTDYDITNLWMFEIFGQANN